MSFLKKPNIADYFSVYRLAAAPVLILLIWADERAITAILLLISFITDAIDGYLARKKRKPEENVEGLYWVLKKISKTDQS